LYVQSSIIPEVSDLVASVSIRELSRNPSRVVDEVTKTGRPALVTKNGRTVAALVPIDEEDLEDFVLSNAPEFVRGYREADEDLRLGRTRDAFEFLRELGGEERVGAAPKARKKGSTRSSSGATKPAARHRKGTRTTRGRR
jgi:prevent-host-death family protein